VVCFLLIAALTVPGRQPTRRVAITFDDLPFVSARSLPADEVRVRTERLLDYLRRPSVSAIGFVNESKLFESGGEDPARVALLSLWLDAGMELGNHTYWHLDLHGAPLVDFERDVIRGDVVIRRLMAAGGREPRFFRHPFLHTGREPSTKAALESFLAERGYRVAPVTIDNHDYQFARAYDLAGENEKEKIREAYLRYMSAVVEYYERQSRAILGYELPQILLVHANSLNADSLGELLDALVERQYAFVGLEEALRDPAFSLPDTYSGSAGITWLHRWAMTREVPEATFAGEPDPAAFLPQLR
jgi:peptidoglycan/xylan/chitin deacetylase (PgdA/CDA1 family)